ncbi:hypothetical protein E2C01_008424 [Portunus trituberculatus]|uniref:Uncharacterized protein n=1 Tax=Portunus trituberculatus TaxID=210409 RepID=A0A5B7D4L6_PORTR|nr:hypothetical protein [Portunus trituberculatus]
MAVFIGNRRRRETNRHVKSVSRPWRPGHHAAQGHVPAPVRAANWPPLPLQADTHPSVLPSRSWDDVAHLSTTTVHYPPWNATPGSVLRGPPRFGGKRGGDKYMGQ